MILESALLVKMDRMRCLFLKRFCPFLNDLVVCCSTSTGFLYFSQYHQHILGVIVLVVVTQVTRVGLLFRAACSNGLGWAYDVEEMTVNIAFHCTFASGRHMAAYTVVDTVDAVDSPTLNRMAASAQGITRKLGLGLVCHALFMCEVTIPTLYPYP